MDLALPFSLGLVSSTGRIRYTIQLVLLLLYNTYRRPRFHVTSHTDALACPPSPSCFAGQVHGRSNALLPEGSTAARDQRELEAVISTVSSKLVGLSAFGFRGRRGSRVAIWTGSCVVHWADSTYNTTPFTSFVQYLSSSSFSRHIAC